jgi:hypothetical protein
MKNAFCTLDPFCLFFRGALCEKDMFGVFFIKKNITIEEKREV